MAKHPGGRPTKYKKEYCQAIYDFFNREPYETIPVIDENGKPSVAVNKFGEPILKPCVLPTFEKFAISIGVHRETLIDWCSVHQEFLDAYKAAKDLQKEILIQNGLSGSYDRTFAIFTAKCVTDMRENQPLGDDDDVRPIRVEIKVSDASVKKTQVMDEPDE